MRYIFVLLFSAILIQPASALTLEVGSVSADYGKTVTVPITVSKAVHGLALSVETSGNIVKAKNRKFDVLQWRRVGSRTMIAAASKQPVSGRVIDLQVRGNPGRHAITAKQSIVKNQWGGYPKRGETIPVAYSATGNMPAVLVAGSLEVAEQDCPPIRWLLLSAKPNPVTKGDIVTLSWQVEGADRVGISDGVFGLGSYGPNDSAKYKVNTDTTYQLSARNDCEASNKSIAVACASSPPAPPVDPPEPSVPPEEPPSCKVAPGIWSFVADRYAIKSGETVTLSWEVSGAETTNITGIGTVSSTGTARVSPAERTRYLMITENQCGQASGQVWVNVESSLPPPLPPPEQSEAESRCQEAIEALQRLKDAGKCDDAYELYREILPIIKGK
jgi:hypothetical protein